MTRGDTVRITKGKASGEVGEVEFVGKTKFGDKVKVLLDSGDAVWVKPDAVVLADAPAPAPAAPAPSLVDLAAAFRAPTANGDAVAALTARVAGLELLVAKLSGKIDGLTGPPVEADAAFDEV